MVCVHVLYLVCVRLCKSAKRFVNLNFIIFERHIFRCRRISMCGRLKDKLGFFFVRQLVVCLLLLFYSSSSRFTCSRCLHAVYVCAKKEDCVFSLSNRINIHENSEMSERKKKRITCVWAWAFFLCTLSVLLLLLLHSLFIRTYIHLLRVCVFFASCHASSYTSFIFKPLLSDSYHSIH